jgi:hypothetical protein
VTEAGRLRNRLKAIGLSDPAIQAAWPEWWSDAADPSPSARLELRFSIARKLGLDPRSLLDEEGAPRFVWRDEARFKHLSGESDAERAAITSFGRALGSLLVAAAPPARGTIAQASASNLRNTILRSQQFVRLVDLLSLSWAVGLPVVHLRVFPAVRKRMAAMAVSVADRNAILLAKDSMYPPHVAFYLAHELAHIALGHVAKDTAIVDLESDLHAGDTTDKEEAEADRFALELLTGRNDPQVVPASGDYNAPGLATAALESGPALGIEPGTLALCFGYSTQNWAIANSAMKFIYSAPKPVWEEVNRLAARELTLDHIPTDARSYVTAVLGAPAAA